MDDKLYDFATEKQKRIIDAVKKCNGNKAQAAKELKLSRSTVWHQFEQVKKKARRQGYDPDSMMEHPVGEPFRVKGTSTLVDKRTGEPVLQWVKTTTDQAALEAIAKEVAQSYIEAIPSRKPVERPPNASESLLSIYPIADPHIGLYVAQEATEKPYDCDIAYQTITQAMSYLIDSSPPSQEALILNLGDFFHSDNMDNRTRRSGHALSVDGDWSEIIKCGIQTMEYLIDLALKKHQKVTVINAIGNHDDHTAYLLSISMDCRYRDEPRVCVNTEFTPHHFHRHGANLIGVHHGHSTKVKDLPGEMAASRPLDWGATKYRWWFTGHIHHQTVQEFPGVTVETMRAVCPRNGYARSKGYTALSDMQVIVLHDQLGQMMRNYISL